MYNLQNFLFQAKFPYKFSEEHLQDYLIEYYRYIGFFVAKEVDCETGRADIVIGHATPQGRLKDAVTGKNYNPTAIIEVKKFLSREDAIQAFGQGVAYSISLGNLPVIIAGLLTTQNPEAARSVKRRFSLTGAKFFFVDETPEYYRCNWGNSPESVLPSTNAPVATEIINIPIPTDSFEEVGAGARNDGDYSSIDFAPAIAIARKVLGVSFAGLVGVTVGAGGFALKTLRQAAKGKRTHHYGANTSYRYSRVDWLPNQSWFKFNKFFLIVFLGYCAFALFTVATQQDNSQQNQAPYTTEVLQ